MNWNLDPRTTMLNEEARLQGLKGALSSAAANEAEARARSAEAALIAEKRQAGSRRNDRDSERIAILEGALAKSNAAKVKAQLEAQEAIASRDSLVLEWMQSNEAFKRLAIKYGKRLNYSEEQILNERREEIINISEEDPQFKETDLTKRVKDKLKTGLK